MSSLRARACLPEWPEGSRQARITCCMQGAALTPGTSRRVRFQSSLLETNGSRDVWPLTTRQTPAVDTEPVVDADDWPQLQYAAVPRTFDGGRQWREGRAGRQVWARHSRQPLGVNSRVGAMRSAPDKHPIRGRWSVGGNLQRLLDQQSVLEGRAAFVTIGPEAARTRSSCPPCCLMSIPDGSPRHAGYRDVYADTSSSTHSHLCASGRATSPCPPLPRDM